MLGRVVEIERRAFTLGSLAMLASLSRVARAGAAYPAAGAVPRVRLGDFPTRVDHAVALGRALGVPALYVKRDDLAGKPYGGSKLRKLELLLGQARSDKSTLVATFGGAGSNQAVATTIYASALGMRTLLLLLPQRPDDEVRDNLLADLRYGAELRASPGQAHEQAVARRIARDRGERATIIPMGGSSPLGNLGFVWAAAELADQVRAGVLPEPDVVYIAMGTMGSAVGLALGLQASGMKTRVVGVRASNPGTSSVARAQAMARRSAAFVHARDAAFPARGLVGDRLVIDGAHLGKAYGVPTRKGRAAIALAKQHAGLELEPVYTGKALSALVDDAPRLRDKVVLFWLTNNSRPLDLAGTDPARLPAAFRGYFAGRRG